MDRSLEQRDFRNRRQRERYAALSDEERQRLALRRRANYARRVSTTVVSSLPPPDEVPCRDFGQHGFACVSHASVVPTVLPMCNTHEPMCAFNNNDVVVGTLSSSFVSSDVGMRCSACDDFPCPPSVSLGSTFEVGGSSSASVGLHSGTDDLLEVVHDGVSPVTENFNGGVVSGSCNARPIDPFSVGGSFEVGQSSSASANVHNEVEVQLLPSRTVPRRSVPANRFDRIMEVPTVPWVLPTASSCLHCGARRFFREGPAFCCSNGHICLPQSRVCAILHFLFTDMSEIACEFRRRGRTYNNGFAFTSIGMSTDADSWLAKEGIYALKVFGQVFHYMNPVDGSPNSKDLLQLFFLDSIDELDQAIVEAKGLRSDIMSLIVDALSSNPYSVFFKRLRSWDNLRDTHVVLKKNPSADQRTHNLPTVDEVAAIWRDVPEGDIGYERDIRVYTDGSRGHKIRYYYGCYDPLQYPILFPYGETGWHAGIKKKKGNPPSTSASLEEPCSGFSAVAPVNLPSAEAVLLQEERVLQANQNSRFNVSCREYTCYRAQIRDSDRSYLLHSGRLGHQFWIDSYIKIETSRFDYYRSEQSQREFRTETFQGIADALCIDGENNPANIGKRILLPSSFIGGPRDMRKRYVNAMALVLKFGKPDLFIAMTCNPGWKEIRDNLLPSEVPHDRPDLIARVFKAKLEELKDEIVRKKLFGDVAAYVYAVEYQKRGLPHVHWVIILTAEHKIISADVYDNIISAEIPDDTHPFLRSYVLRHMMHGPCGEANPSNVCMQDGFCKNHYPKTFSEDTIHGQGTYPCYRRRDNGRSVRVRNVPLDNRWVIPHCPRLLAKFDCHINVEICSDIELVKYLYKYIYKGHDKASYHVVADGSHDTYDEIQAYQAACYICAPEALWRIFGFPMSEIYPPVIVLPVHLPNHQPLRFGLEPTLEQLLKNPLSSKTMLT